MANSKYTAPNDFRAFCEALGETETSMCHHGVKGMHWGERKYQDYNGRLTALGRQHYGYGAKKKAETEEDPKKKTSDMDKKLEELENRYQFNKPYTARDPLVRAAIKATLEFDKERTHGLHQGETEERKRARDDTKSMMTLAYGSSIGIGALYGTGVGAATGAVGIGAGIGAAAGVAAGTYLSIPVMANYAAKAISAKHANNKMEKQIKEIQNNTNVDKKSGVKLKNKEMTADEDMAYVNPGFNNWSDNTKNNCLLCSNAYALRRKGYDVMANGASDGYMGQIFTHFYPNAQMRRVKLPSYISKSTMPELVNALGIPDGGYGAISVTWKGDQGGHSMIYAVENGKPVIRDCQSNKIYRGVKVRQTLENTTKDVRITRLDNVEPDLKAMINANAINPGGQNFKAIKTEAEKAYESYKTPLNADSVKNGHGDTGLMNNKFFKKLKPGNVNYYDDITGEKTNESYRIGVIDDYLNVSKKDIKALRKDPDFKSSRNVMKDFRKTGDIANAVNEINKINKIKPTKTDLDNVLKATYPSRYDGKKMGLSSDLKLERITPNYERPEKSSAYYSSTIKNGGRDVKIYIDVPASGGSYKDGKMEERVKVATQVATNKDFLKEVKTKKEILLNDVNEQDAKQLMKTAYVAWVDVNSSGKNGHYGLRGYKTNGNKEYMEGQFMTLPNGKIVPLEPYVTELD